jgi:outer membrane usher protein
MPGCRLNLSAIARFAIVGMLTLDASPLALAQSELPPITVNSQLLNLPSRLQLEVYINGQPVGYIEEFTHRPQEGLFFARRSDLEEAGIKTPPGSPDDSLSLASLGCAFAYDASLQRMNFTLNDSQRLPRVYNARGDAGHVTPQVDPGLLLNYSLFGGSVSANGLSNWRFTGANALLDARAFSKLGVVSQSAIVGRTVFRANANFLRLDTTYAYTHPGTLMTYRAGDFISNGLAWTRPVRLGGLQAQRDFLLRPDLVTRPLPSISGSAAVPSSIDVYVNGVKAYSQEVGIGPYRISDLPGGGGNGEARAVIRDATGRQTETSISFQNVAQLLRPGLADFSVEAGFARRNYGVVSQDYDRRPVGSATLRRGMTDWLTLEGHAEGGAGLANGGLGAVAGLGRLGSLSAAGAASHVNGATGWQGYASWDAQFKWFSLSASVQRASRSYEDIASVTAPSVSAQQQLGLTLDGSTLPFSSTVSAHPALAIDRVSIGGPLPFDAETSLNFGLVRVRQREGASQRLITASLTRSLPVIAGFGRGNVFLSGFADVATSRNRGVYAGLSMPFGLEKHISSGVSWNPVSHFTASVEAVKPQPLENNTYGWRVRDSEGRSAFRIAGASYRSPYGLAAAQVSEYGGAVAGAAQLDGSLALIGGGVFVGNRVDTSFAVVNAGRPGVPVMQDNRVVGTTNSFGKLLVPNLRAYEANRIGVDPSKLPPDQDIGTTTRIVAPMLRSGLVLDFGAAQSRSNAIVVLQGPDGKPIATGAKVRLAGSPEKFIVGYDGRTYLTGLGKDNRLSVDLGARDCAAEFAFRPQSGIQTLVRGVVCQ